MTKDEIEGLLRHGAYDLFNEEKIGRTEEESSAFVNADIESILAGSKTIVDSSTGSKSNAAGGTFSKASFRLSQAADNSSTGDIDVDDPDFWKKMLGHAADKSTEDVNTKRRRRKTNYCEKEYDITFNEHCRVGGPTAGGDADSDYSEHHSEPSDADESLSGRSQTEVGATKILSVGKNTGRGWKTKNVNAIIDGLLAFGYNKEKLAGLSSLSSHGEREVR